MGKQITFYDIPTKAPRKCWSPNPWKTRMVLNYKELDYRTVWVEYPDVEPLIKPHLPPNDGFIAYTCPTIQLPDGEWIMDSRKIAERLDKLYPERPLGIASDPYLDEVIETTDKLILSIVPDFVPKVAQGVLGEASLEFFHRTREVWFGGKKLDEIAVEQGGAQVYDKARPFAERIGELLSKDSAGPYFQGKTVSYADFIWAPVLLFLEELDDTSLKRLLGANSSTHLALLEACRPWFARNDR